jgi:HSP20 family molecular chaperone IbpA
MALVKSKFRDDWLEDRRKRFDDWAIREPIWHDRFLNDWPDWPQDWPHPRDVVERFWRDTERWWNDWPSDWPRMDSIMPRFSNQLDRMDPSWRNSDFWKEIYPRWAEPIFKEGIDVKTNIVNDNKRFAVDIDAYQFKPEELQVKTLDDTLIIEGRHEDVKDQDNFTKMYFVRKYQLPRDVEPQSVASSIDSNGRLTIEAPKRYQAIEGRERTIPIESPSRFRSSSYSRDRDYRESGRDSSARREEDRYRDDRVRHEQRNGNSVLPPTERGRSPAPPNDYRGRSPAPPPNDYRRGEYEAKQTDSAGMRYEARREEYRSESRNGYSSLHPENGYHNGRAENGHNGRAENGYRSISRPRDDRENLSHREERRGSADRRREEERTDSRQGYRVDTPGSGIRDDERSESRSESGKSVRILRKTFS